MGTSGAAQVARGAGRREDRPPPVSPRRSAPGAHGLERGLQGPVLVLLGGVAAGADRLDDADGAALAEADEVVGGGVGGVGPAGP
ncbi:MAG: hypothetical protein ACK559_05695, partial [bacterium]